MKINTNSLHFLIKDQNSRVAKKKVSPQELSIFKIFKLTASTSDVKKEFNK